MADTEPATEPIREALPHPRDSVVYPNPFVDTTREAARRVEESVKYGKLPKEVVITQTFKEKAARLAWYVIYYSYSNIPSIKLADGQNSYCLVQPATLLKLRKM